MKKFVKYMFITSFVLSIFLILMNVKYVDAGETYPFNGTIVADVLAVHKTDDYYNSSEVTQLSYGSKVVVTGQGANGSRYIIKYDGDKVGYVSKNYVVNVDANYLTKDAANVETYSSYCQSLKSKGFPDSYCPYLYYLHSQHPKWVFNADYIDKTLAEVAKNELWKNVLQTENSNYWISDSPIEGNYYYVNEAVISSYLDPRNSMFETQIFQFLDYEATKDIANDDALRYISGTGNLSDYFNDFKAAATANGVNPLHLLSRSLNEGANNRAYTAINGQYTTTYGRYATNGMSLDGYYNFFNIGAWATSEYTTVGRGLAYAAGFLEKDKACFITQQDGSITYDEEKCGSLSYGRPWNTQAKAIAGGAMFISASYVKMGQNTNYFEKFNVSSNAKYDLFTHQYMTNIYAPAAEALTVSNAYRKGNLMDSAFTFIIPVYKDMGADIYQPIDKDSNSKLKSIVVDGKEITGFDSDVVEYSYNCVTDADGVEVSALALSTKSKVTGTGKKNFKDGVASYSIVVTAENGDKTTYKLTVKKVVKEKEIKLNDIVSKMGVKLNDTYMYQISPGTNVTGLVETVTSNKGTATVVDSSGKAKTSGILATGDSITISGTIEKKTYKIAIRGDTNGDGIISVLDLLRCQKHILQTIILEGEQYYASDTNYDGVINVLDLLKIQKHILGTESL